MSDLPSNIQTVQDCVNYATTYLQDSDVYFGHGVDNALDEAVRLVWFCLGLAVDGDDSVLQQKISGEQWGAIKAMLITRVKERKPLAYLTNQGWFMGMPFYVDNRVLVPRSPFAELIAKKFSPWIEEDQVTTILEIGTGCGCMAIATAHVFAHTQVVATDISQDALDVAAINLKAHELQDRVTLHQSDCFDQIAATKFDIIMSNPPYVSAQDMRTLPLEYKSEPAHALEASQVGLAIVKKIIRHAQHYLQPHGILVVEVGLSQDLLIETFPQVPFIWLQLDDGGEGIFLLDYASLSACIERK